MVISVVGGKDLDRELTGRWDAVQRADPRLASPFFRPEFVEAVAASRADVRIGVIAEAGRPTAFFPFQRLRSGAAVPAGARLADYHGLIGEVNISAPDLLRAAGLRSFAFSGVPASQELFEGFRRSTRLSPVLELASGFDEYAAGRRAAGSDQVVDAEKQRDRIERRLGPVRFVSHVPGPDALARLLAWKSAQYQRTGAIDIFGIPWVVDVVERVHASQAPAFSGLLSYLFAGDTPVAAHLGPRSGGVWHYWLPAYAREHASLSPGLVLLVEMARHARELGVDVIDLGKGDALYKRRLMNGSVEIVEGTVAATQRAAAGLRLRRAAGRAVDWTPAAGYLARRSARKGFA